MSLRGRFPEAEIHRVDGSFSFAVGANRLCRMLKVDRTSLDRRTGEKVPIVYEIRLRFTVPEEKVLDMKSIELHEVD